MTPLPDQWHIENVIKDVIKRLDDLEDPNTNRWLVMPIIDDLWALLIDIQTTPVSGASRGSPPEHSGT